jgi:hypothetical protein
MVSTTRKWLAVSFLSTVLNTSGIFLHLRGISMSSSPFLADVFKHFSILIFSEVLAFF